MNSQGRDYHLIVSNVISIRFFSFAKDTILSTMAIIVRFIIMVKVKRKIRYMVIVVLVAVEEDEVDADNAQRKRKRLLLVSSGKFSRQR